MIDSFLASVACSGHQVFVVCHLPKKEHLDCNTLSELSLLAAIANLRCFKNITLSLSPSPNLPLPSSSYATSSLSSTEEERGRSGFGVVFYERLKWPLLRFLS